MINKKGDIFLKVLNISLLILFMIMGSIFLIITTESKKEIEKTKNQIEIGKYSFKDNIKENTMLNNELLIEKAVETKDSDYEEEQEVITQEDVDMEYAVKLFESSVNENLKKFVKKPFNYQEGSFCYMDVELSKESFKIKNCNPDNIFKREIEIGFNKIKPIKKFTYNNINLGNKKISIKLRID